MLDIRFIRENPKKVQDSADKKGYKVSIKALLELDDQRRSLGQQVDTLREQRNRISSQMKGGRPSPELIEQGKAIKEELIASEAEFSGINEEYQTAIQSIPNVIFDDVPVGGEEDSVEVKRWGEQNWRD